VDPYQLGQDVGRLLFDLIPILLFVGTVATIGWAIARTSRDKAERQQRIEPRYPSASSDPQTDDPAPPVKKRATTKVVLIAVAGLAVVLAGGAAIVVASAGPPSATDTAANSPATTAVSPTPSPSAAPTSATPTPAPTTAAPSATFATVAAWYRGGGKARIDKIAADNLAIRNAQKNKDDTALRDACTQMLADATAAKGFAPIPDGQAQPHWAKSLPLIVQGALDCSDAIDEGGGNTLLQDGVVEMNSGVIEFNLAVARLNALLG